MVVHLRDNPYYCAVSPAYNPERLPSLLCSFLEQLEGLCSFGQHIEEVHVYKLRFSIFGERDVKFYLLRLCYESATSWDRMVLPIPPPDALLINKKIVQKG